MIKAYAKSDVGKAREKNEDSFYITEDPFNDVQLFILADGLSDNLPSLLGVSSPNLSAAHAWANS